MSDLRRFQKDDPVRHRAGRWAGRVLYVTQPRVDGPLYARVAWIDDHKATTENTADLEFATTPDPSQLDIEEAIAATKLESQP